MISIKKHLDLSAKESAESLCDCYRASLSAMGVSATQICPHIGEDFQRDLSTLRDRLSPQINAETARETGKQVEEAVARWGEQASGYFQQTARQVKEIMLMVAATAQAVGDRDQRYAREFGDFAGQLASIGHLEDLTKIRESLGKNAHQLKLRVEKMVEEGEQSVAQMRAEISAYQARLDEVERVATQDPVTGIANRYKGERQIQFRIDNGKPLSIAMFDLDDFKQINDQFGHLAGDDLLRQFAGELRSFFGASDVICRWGGDEFLVIVDCAESAIRGRVEPVRQWVEGEYTIQINGASREVKVGASVGIASWRAGETAAGLIARADAAMYSEKFQRKRDGGGAAAPDQVQGRRP